MAFFSNQLAVEPFEEQVDKAKTANKADLDAFYQEQQKEVVERKLSKRRSNSIWTRKTSGKRTSVSPQTQSKSDSKLPQRHQTLKSNKNEDNEREMEQLEINNDRDPNTSPLPITRSIVPDSLNELPAWYRANDPSYYRSRFPMHNPVGPKYYRNIHLVPPGQRKATSRPPSVFSPSFPPIATTSSMPERSDESFQSPALSRTPSNSPLPTPTSSQTRVEDPTGKPRVRKTSETAHDGVDLLDVDPWGTSWHHGSPYDIGLGNGPVSPEVEIASQTRSRGSNAATKDVRRKTVTPSPLSQSTSALNLEVPAIQLPRKLSKRRTSGSKHANSNDFASTRTTISLPATPIDPPARASPSASKHDTLILPSSAPPSSYDPSLRSSKRGSVLGRIVKKFSLLKRSTHVPEPQKPVRLAVKPKAELRYSQAVHPQPPPAIADPPTVVTPEPQSAFLVSREAEKPYESDRDSQVSLEPPFSMGRLTVANPDVPGSAGSTPAFPEFPLPLAVHSVPLYVSQSREASAQAATEPRPEATLPVQAAQPSDGSNSLPPFPEPMTLEEVQAQLASQSSKEMQVEVQHQRRSRSPKKRKPPPETPAIDSTLSSPMPPPRDPSKFSGTINSFEGGSPAFQGSLAAFSPPFANDMVNGSPLSAVSMEVNPPTPHIVGKDIPPPSPQVEPPPLPPKQLSSEGKRSHRDPSPGAQRQTEKFKLVRSLSGNVYASSETIMAAGEQWEVREHRPSTKPSDPEINGRKEKEHRREERTKHKSDVDATQRRKSRSSHRSSKVPTEPVSSEKPLPPPATENRPSASPERKKLIDKPQPAPPPPTPGPSTKPLERKSSVSTRPISEVPPTASLNALGAKEAWELERLWKAKSLYNAEPNGHAMPAMTISMPGPDGVSDPTMHGSSHTSYVVQNTFQAQPPGSHIYHSMPTSPPPFIYASSSNVDHRASSIHSIPSIYSSRSLDQMSSAPSQHPLTSNPLPEPPRESSYQPAPIPIGTSWMKYTEVP